MIQKQLTTIAAIFFTGFTSLFLPLAVQAQDATTDTNPTPNVVNCTKRDVPANGERDTQKVAQNLMLNAFSYASVHDRLLCDPLIVGVLNEDGKSTTTSVYKTSQTLVNLFTLVVLVIIAFANILRVKLDTYAVKKAIPMLVFGIIMANLALPIIRTIVDFSGVLTATFIGNASDAGTKKAFVESLIQAIYHGGVQTLGTTASNFNQSGGHFAEVLELVGIGGLIIGAWAPLLLGLIVLALFLILLPAFLIIYLGVLFVARIYVLVILAAVSPIAFASLGFEPLKGKVWGWWWTQFIKWTFMAPATFFLFWLGIQFYRAAGDRPDIGTYIVVLGLIGAATQIPSKMGGSIMTQWAKFTAEPLKNAFKQGFAAPTAYVKSATPRDFSRFYSSKTLGSITRPFLRGAAGQRIQQAIDGSVIGRTPLNVAKATREGIKNFGEIVEKKNVEKEAASPAVRTGLDTGYVLANIGIKGLDPRAYQKALQDINSPARKLQITQLADQALKELGIDGLRYDQLNKDQVDELDKHIDGMLAKNSPLISSAAYYAQARLGNHAAADDPKFMDAFRNQGMDKTQIAAAVNLFGREYALRTGLPAPVSVSATPGTPADSKETLQAVSDLRKSLGRVANNSDEQKRIFSLMLEQLKHATKDLKELKVIEEHPNYRALATVLLENYQKLDDSKMQEDVRKMWDKRAELGLVDAIDVFNRNQLTGQILLGKLKASSGFNVKWEDLQALLRKDGASEDSFRYLDGKQRDALMSAFENIDDTKKALEKHMEFEIAQLGTTGDKAQLSAAAKLIKEALKSGQAGAMPEANFDTAYAAMADKQLAERLKARMNALENVLQNLQHMNESGTRALIAQRAQERINAQQAAASPGPSTKP